MTTSTSLDKRSESYQHTRAWIHSWCDYFIVSFNCSIIELITIIVFFITFQHNYHLTPQNNSKSFLPLTFYLDCICTISFNQLYLFCLQYKQDNHSIVGDKTMDTLISITSSGQQQRLEELYLCMRCNERQKIHQFLFNVCSTILSHTYAIELVQTSRKPLSKIQDNFSHRTVDNIIFMHEI